jgi:hypothetical protein
LDTADVVVVCTSSSWSLHAASIFSTRLTSAGRARSFCRSCSASAALEEGAGEDLEGRADAPAGAEGDAGAAVPTSSAIPCKKAVWMLKIRFVSAVRLNQQKSDGARSVPSTSTPELRLPPARLFPAFLRSGEGVKAASCPL